MHLGLPSGRRAPSRRSPALACRPLPWLRSPALGRSRLPDPIEPRARPRRCGSQGEKSSSHGTRCWREPNSNHHSLSYDLPRTELDRVWPGARRSVPRLLFSRRRARAFLFRSRLYQLVRDRKHPHVYYKGAASAMRTCSGRMPIPINRAGMRRRTGKISKSLKNSGGFGRRSLSRTRLMIRL
jgi:hypothetical protein